MGKGLFTREKKSYLIERVSESEVFDLGEFGKPISNPLTLVKGLHTIRITEKDDPFLFNINEKNLIPGYVDADKTAKTLDLTSNKPKLLITAKGSVYHFFMDDVAGIIEAIKEYPNHELIIDVGPVSTLIGKEGGGYTFFYDFLWLLKFYNIKHKVVNLMDFNIVYINDFYYIDHTKISSARADNIYEYFSEFIKNKDQKPFRSVYVSRKKQDANAPHATTNEETGFVYDGLRIDDETGLENLFSDLGFEIIYPEDFEDFDKQVNFFNSVKTIASLTSSGLTNATFMQPGGTVIEIVSPIIARPITPDGTRDPLQKAIHNFYKDISFLKKHFYVTIQNPNFKLEDVKNAIESNEKLKQFLTVTDE